MKQYTIEKEGQIDFFSQYKIDWENNEVLVSNTDGVWNGNIFEFKLEINNIYKVLFQAIKYLSKLRIKGQNVPSNILLISLNDKKVYYFQSKDFFKEIHTIYYSAASKNNENFNPQKNHFNKTIDYSTTTGAIELQQLLKENKFLSIDIDENCIVGWAERYYREVENARKGDFLGDSDGQNNITGEIREPKHFKDLINPYIGKTNEKFKYLMDKLNDNLSKKRLGAFYTPVEYSSKVAELVRKAIKRVPIENDYIIFDRCAGTGNLEAVLTEEELSHCVLSTYEYYEYKVLIERLGDKVRFIVPPTEELAEYENGFVKNANALTEEYINNIDIKNIIDNPKITIIMLENPPYQDSSAKTFVEDGDKTKRAKTNTSKTFVAEELKKEVYKLNEKNGVVRELSNLFIWSAFKYYLRQPTDSYIVLSPVKYFKTVGLVKKKFGGGFAFNRKYFHATPSLISCVLWYNIDEENDIEWKLEAIDINEEKIGNTIDYSLNDLRRKIIVKKCSKKTADYNDLRTFSTDIETNVVCNASGIPNNGYTYKKGRKPLYNDNIIGYMTTIGYSLDSNHRNLVRMGYTTGLEQSFGYYLRKDNCIEKLPIFCAKLYPETNWYEKDIFFTTSDNGNSYIKDKILLKSAFIYTCLTHHNKIMSFKGQDGKLYKNELCLDNYNTPRKTNNFL